MLEFSWPAFAFAVVNFLILVGLLYRFLHKPILAVLEQRRQGIADAEQAAKQEAVKARQAQTDYEAKQASLLEEREVLLAEARKTVEKTKDEILRKAKEDAERETTSRLRAFERERHDALKDLEDGITAVALETARGILAKTVDADVESRLQALLLSQLRAESKASDTAAAGKQKPGAMPELTNVRVNSAKELSPSDREALLTALTSLGSAESAVEFIVDAELLAGSRVEFADRAIDASLADVLTAMRERVAELAAETAPKETVPKETAPKETAS